MKKTDAITMSRNDALFLKHWIEYYDCQTGKENLYIYLGGTDQPVPENAGTASVTHCERIAGQVVSTEKRPFTHLSTVVFVWNKPFMEPWKPAYQIPEKFNKNQILICERT